MGSTIQVGLAEARSQLALAQEQSNLSKASYYQNQIDLIMNAIKVTITPKPCTVAGSSTVEFTASCTGDINNAGVTWEIALKPRGRHVYGGPNHLPGSLSASSGPTTTYTAPASQPPPDFWLTQAIQIIARSVTNPNVFDVVEFTIQQQQFAG